MKSILWRFVVVWVVDGIIGGQVGPAVEEWVSRKESSRAW